MMLPKLCHLEERKVLIGDNLFSHLSDAVIKAWSQSNTAFVCLCPNVTHVLQPLEVAWFVPLKKIWRKTFKDWKRSPHGLRHKGSLPKEHFKKLLKTLVSKLEESGASSENSVIGFCKCGLYSFNPNIVYESLFSNFST